jgi:hypothetical protein
MYSVVFFFLNYYQSVVLKACRKVLEKRSAVPGPESGHLSYWNAKEGDAFLLFHRGNFMLKGEKEKRERVEKVSDLEKSVTHWKIS